MSKRWNATWLIGVEWGFLLAAIGLWVASEAFRPWMNYGVGFLVISWGARWVRIGKFSRPTPIDMPLILFLVSALIAWQIAPNQPAALARLYLLLGATGIYYSIINSKEGSLRKFANGLIIIAAIAGIYFVSQRDWVQYPARFALTNKMGQILNQTIPDFGLDQPHWNFVRNGLAAGLALLIPITLVRVAAEIGNFTKANPRSPVKPRLGWLDFGITCIGGILIIIALVMTESRTPWLVAIIIAGITLWWLLSAKIHKKTNLNHIPVFWAGLGVIAVLGVFGVLFQQQLVAAFAKLPGPNTALGRQEIYAQSWLLAQDTQFTGGGLAAFPALYSTYMRVNPFNVFLNEDTGNNAYLNIFVEQGWIGIISYVSLITVAIWTGVQRIKRVDQTNRGLIVAGTLGLAFITLHGFAHATLVATRAIPMLLIPAGLALSGPRLERSRPLPARGHTHRIRLGIISILVGLVIIILLFSRFWLAAWHANLGSVEMAATELQDWPTGKWDDGNNVTALAPAEQTFHRSLTYDPHNRTANHRLGLVWMLRREFVNAAGYLEAAHAASPNHRGIIKSLGYCYTWLGEFDEAEWLLAQIPEAQSEMQTYVWWWGTQRREDLAANASQMSAQLDIHP